MTPLAAKPPNYRQHWLPWALQWAKNIDNNCIQFLRCFRKRTNKPRSPEQNKQVAGTFAMSKVCPGKKSLLRGITSTILPSLVSAVFYIILSVSTTRKHPGLVPQNNSTFVCTEDGKWLELNFRPCTLEPGGTQWSCWEYLS